MEVPLCYHQWDLWHKLFVVIRFHRRCWCYYYLFLLLVPQIRKYRAFPTGPSQAKTYRGKTGGGGGVRKSICSSPSFIPAIVAVTTPTNEDGSWPGDRLYRHVLLRRRERIRRNPSYAVRSKWETSELKGGLQRQQQQQVTQQMHWPGWEQRWCRWPMQLKPARQATDSSLLCLLLIIGRTCVCVCASIWWIAHATTHLLFGLIA